MPENETFAVWSKSQFQEEMMKRRSGVVFLLTHDVDRRLSYCDTGNIAKVNSWAKSGGLKDRRAPVVQKVWGLGLSGQLRL